MKKIIIVVCAMLFGCGLLAPAFTDEFNEDLFDSFLNNVHQIPTNNELDKGFDKSKVTFCRSLEQECGSCGVFSLINAMDFEKDPSGKTVTSRASVENIINTAGRIKSGYSYANESDIKGMNIHDKKNTINQNSTLKKILVNSSAKKLKKNLAFLRVFSCQFYENVNGFESRFNKKIIDTRKDHGWVGSSLLLNQKGMINRIKYFLEDRTRSLIIMTTFYAQTNNVSGMHANAVRVSWDKNGQLQFQVKDSGIPYTGKSGKSLIRLCREINRIIMTIDALVKIKQQEIEEKHREAKELEQALKVSRDEAQQREAVKLEQVMRSSDKTQNDRSSSSIVNHSRSLSGEKKKRIEGEALKQQQRELRYKAVIARKKSNGNLCKKQSKKLPPIFRPQLPVVDEGGGHDLDEKHAFEDDTATQMHKARLARLNPTNKKADHSENFDVQNQTQRPKLMPRKKRPKRKHRNAPVKSIGFQKAIAEGRTEDVKLMLRQARCVKDLDIYDRYNDIPLVIAAHYGHLDIVKVLVKAGFYSRGFALVVACEQGHVDVVKYLLTKVNSRSRPSRSSETFFDIAITKTTNTEILNCFAQTYKVLEYLAADLPRTPKKKNRRSKKQSLAVSNNSTQHDGAENRSGLFGCFPRISSAQKYKSNTVVPLNY